MAGRHPRFRVVGARDTTGRSGHGRRRLHAAGDDGHVHSGPDRAGRGADRGETGRAVTIVGEPRHVLEPGLDRRVAGDVATAVERLAEDHVVEETRVDAGPVHDLAHHRRAQLESVDVDQRALERGADRRPRRCDDHCITHESALLAFRHRPCRSRTMFPPRSGPRRNERPRATRDRPWCHPDAGSLRSNGPIERTR